MSHIITRWVNPPIPERGFDWCATFEGYEPGEPIGYGRSEQDAVSALFDSREQLEAESANE